MQVTCLRSGKVSTFEDIETARQYHGAVLIKRSGTSSERLIPDARLVEATATDDQPLLVNLDSAADLPSAVADAAVVRERDRTVRTWDENTDVAQASATKYENSTLQTVTELE